MAQQDWRSGLLVSLFLTISAFGQVTDPTLAGQDPPASLHIGTIQVHGLVRGRAEGWNWFYRGDRTVYGFGESQLQISFSQHRSRLDWKIAFEQPALYNLPADALDNGIPLGLGGSYYAANHAHQNTANLFVNQAFVRIGGIAGNNGRLQIGRFEFTEGWEGQEHDASLAWLKHERIAGRMIGNSYWTAVTRSLDGIRFSDDVSPHNSFDFVAARVSSGVYQTNGWNDLNVALLYGAYARDLPLGQVVSQLRVFGIGYRDGRNTTKVDNRPLAARQADTQPITIGTFGGDYIMVFPVRYLGKWDLLTWGAVQTGSWGLLDHHAGAATGEAGWHPRFKWLHPWLRAGALYASSDGNADDGKHTTFFQMLPTDRQYARIPFYTLQNLEDYTGQLILLPSPRLTLHSEVHKVKLHGKHDLWYQGSGAFQKDSFGYVGAPAAARGGLANFLDISADYQATPRLRLTYYFGILSGKATLTSDLRGQKGGFTYFEFEYAF